MQPQPGSKATQQSICAGFTSEKALTRGEIHFCACGVVICVQERKGLLS